MKKTFIILCLFASIATQAQYDTLPYNIGIPNYFTTHTFDSMHVTSHDNRSCVPRATNLITFNNVYESSHSQGLALPVVVPYATEGDFSYGFYPDSTIHIIGMAWFNYIDKLSIGSWDTIDVKLFHPSGNYMMPLVKKRITRDTFSFSKVLDLGRGWDASDITNWSVYNISAPLYEVYFDNEIDISDSLYLSVKFTWSSDGWPKNLDVTAGWTEGHSPIIPDSDPKIYPIQSYRMKDTPGDDDPWTYGEMHAYPLLFPIIRLDGDTCPEVREVRYTRVGNSAAIAQWDAGTNHRDWQLCYGPQGFDPEGADVVNTTVPQRALTGLTATGHYDVYVKARCRFARDEWTPWAGPFSFSMSEIGIEDGPARVEFSVTPNPAHGNATVRCEAGLQTVELLGVKGDVLLCREAAGSEACVLDLTGLAKGVYVVRITTPLGTAAQKLVVE